MQKHWWQILDERVDERILLRIFLLNSNLIYRINEFLASDRFR